MRPKRSVACTSSWPTGPAWAAACLPKHEACDTCWIENRRSCQESEQPGQNSTLRKWRYVFSRFNVIVTAAKFGPHAWYLIPNWSRSIPPGPVSATEPSALYTVRRAQIFSAVALGSMET